MKLHELTWQRHHNNQSFYLSFSDIMVLLNVFFALLVSMSEIDVGTFERIRTEFTGKTQDTLVALAQELQETIAQDDAISGVAVRLAKDGVRMDLDTAALFDSGKAVLREDALAGMAILFRGILATSYRVDVEGHTDDAYFFRVTEGEIENNWSLSGQRAAAVLNELKQLGFRDDRLRVVGYAATRPLVPVTNKTGQELQKARTQNRRVSILIR